MSNVKGVKEKSVVDTTRISINAVKERSKNYAVTDEAAVLRAITSHNEGHEYHERGNGPRM